MTSPPKPRSPFFWIAIVAGVTFAGCCFFSAGLLALGALADEPAGAVSTTTTPTPSGGKWLVATEVARSGALNQSLTGGRWIAQYGSSVDTVVARSGTTAWVQSNTSGSLYELVFDDDGNYAVNWVSSITMYGATSRSHCTEKGTWSLSGTQLTLQPESQEAVYSNASGSQEKSDMDIRERVYQVVDLTLETLDAPKQQVAGLSMIGPEPSWDTASGDRWAFTLQRLSE